jgi:hypothetical protein
LDRRLDDLEKRKFLTLPGLELRPLGRPARRQSNVDIGGINIEADVSFESKAIAVLTKLDLLADVTTVKT